MAFAIQTAHLPVRVAHWRVLFVVEGAPSVLLGVAALALLPNRPEETRFLEEGERAMALERVNRGARADVGRVVNRGEAQELDRWREVVGWIIADCGCCVEHVWAAFKDPRVCCLV